MNTEIYKKEVDKYLALWNKYFEEGNKEKERECLKKLSQLQKERWEHEKSELKKLYEEVGVPFDDLQKE